LISRGNAPICENEYFLSNRNKAKTNFRIALSDRRGVILSSVLIASGCGSLTYKDSAFVLGKDLYLAIGYHICSFSLPKLELTWCREVDLFACRGIYYLPRFHCLITLGEQEINCLGTGGDIKWSLCGKDLFYEGFYLFSDRIEVIDFNHEKYTVDVLNGHIRMN
jgi:hypothetical protein